MKNIKQANINVSIKDLFNKWLNITKTFHNLNNQEQNVLSLFLYHHYLLKKDIKNKKILWKIVFDYDTKLKIKEELNLKDTHLQNLMTRLRKKNIIIDGKINPYFIPEITDKSDNFKVIFNFNIINEK